MLKKYAIAVELIFSTYICFSCSCSNNNHNIQDFSNNSDTSYKDNTGNSPYKVYKIDSVNNFYLIYVSKNGTRYKIISNKEYGEKCDIIQKGKYYDFKLRSLLANESMEPGLVGCVHVDNTTKICVEPKDSVYDLNRAANIKGLCFEKRE